MYLVKAWNAIAAGVKSRPAELKRKRRTSRRTLHEPLEPRWLMTGTANPLGTISTTTGAAYVGNPIFFPSQTTQIHQAAGGDGGNPSAAAIAPDGVVEYGTGIAQLSATPALQSDVGVKFGITLLWSNQVAAALGPTGNPTLGSNRFGYGITAAEIPQLIAAGSITFTDGVGSVAPTLESNGAVDSIIVTDGSRRAESGTGPILRRRAVLRVGRDRLLRIAPGRAQRFFDNLAGIRWRAMSRRTARAPNHGDRQEFERDDAAGSRQLVRHVQ
jgi:hypothetical protein